MRHAPVRLGLRLLAPGLALIGVGCGFPEGVTDGSAPLIAITAPGDRSTVSGTVTIEAAAQDDVGVTKVTILVDGKALAELTTGPYRATWSTTGVPDGLHSIEAVALDAAGNRGRDLISVTVNSRPQ